MRDGFLGNHTSFMLDVIVCALVLVVPVLAYSIYAVRFQKRFQLHKTLQIGLGTVIALAVVAFEIDMQLVQGGWENVVAKRTVPLSAEEFDFVRSVLRVHLIFAISTPVLWGVTIVYALKRFPRPPAPGEHSRLHKRLAWLSAIDLTLTSVTGLLFYYFAFVA